MPPPPPRVLLVRARRLILRWNYWIFHLAYFAVLGFLGGGIITAVSRNVSFVDGLFTGVSAICVTGLTVVDTEALAATSQAVTLVLILLGGLVVSSTFPPLIRMFFLCRTVATAKQRADDDDGHAHAHAAMEMKSILLWLIFVPLCYYSIMLLLGFMVLASYGAGSTAGQRVLKTNDNLNAGYWGFYYAASGLNNAGFALLASSLMEFNRQPVPLLMVAFLILVGNTMYPILLRSIFVVLRRCLKGRPAEAPLTWILNNPRRYFVHLFPWKQTLWLITVIVCFTTFEFSFMIWLDWNSIALEGMGPGTKILNGLTQTISTRTAGFNSIDIAALAIPMQVLYTGMMYVAAIPVAVSIRRTQVTTEHDESGSFRYQAQQLFLRDLVLVFLAWFTLCVAERDHLRSDPSNYTPFKLLFEVCSAFGTVGLSLGFAGEATSFSGKLHHFSKLVLILVMLLGRNRGLPHAIDPATRIETASPSPPPPPPSDPGIPTVDLI